MRPLKSFIILTTIVILTTIISLGCNSKTKNYVIIGLGQSTGTNSGTETSTGSNTGTITGTGTETGTIPEFFIDFIDDIPDLCQTDPQLSLPGQGKTYCGPVSASNSLMWLANDRGYANLVDPIADPKLQQGNLALILGSDDYMCTSLTYGTSPEKLLIGLKLYILDRSYDYDRLEFQGWRSCPPEFDTNVMYPDPDWIKQGIAGNFGVLLNIAWYYYNFSTQEYTRASGHWITAVGYGIESDLVTPNPDIFIIHNPGYSGDQPLNAFILLTRLSEGTLVFDAQTRLSANGMYSITEGIFMGNYDFIILESAIILQMSQ